jgi:hypothetical protein
MVHTINCPSRATQAGALLVWGSVLSQCAHLISQCAHLISQCAHLISNAQDVKLHMRSRNRPKPCQ